MTIKRICLVGVFAVVAALASSVVDGSVLATYPDIMGCEHSCRVAAGGWPAAYLVDYPGISPTGSVSLTDAMLGVDVFRPLAFAVTFGSRATSCGARVA